MNANKILFRCSSLGHLMTDPRGAGITEKQLDYIKELESERDNGVNKNGNSVKWTDVKGATLKELIAKRDAPPELSETTKTHLVDVYVREKYNRFTEIHGKQLDKGNDVEEDSITTISLATGQFLRKNEVQLQNRFIRGTPDIYTGKSIKKADTVRDAKSSWEVFTFNRAIFDEIKKLNYWQVVGYMDITGAKEAFVDYCLNNTPYHILERELYMESFRHEGRNTPNWIELQTIANHVYDKKTFDQYISIRGISFIDEACHAVYHGFVEIPLEERHFAFHVERKEEEIKALHERVELARSWMNKHLFKTKAKRIKAKQLKAA